MTTIEKLYPAIRGHRITTDSRQIIRGDIFIALKGENFDGNRYAAAALEQGAALAIIDNADYLSPGCELVADSLLFLQQLAHYHRQQLHIPILGITGTNGKTTTKELCHAVLSKKFKTFATQGNFNNHIGVPLTLLSMDETTEFGIVEMGANHPGEIKTLSAIVANTIENQIICSNWQVGSQIPPEQELMQTLDRKSTRLNSSHRT